MVACGCQRRIAQGDLGVLVSFLKEFPQLV